MKNDGGKRSAPRHQAFTPSPSPRSLLPLTAAPSYSDCRPRCMCPPPTLATPTGAMFRPNLLLLSPSTYPAYEWAVFLLPLLNSFFECPSG